MPFAVCETFLKTKSLGLCSPFCRNFSFSCTGHVGFDVLAIKIHEPSRYWSFFLFSRKNLIYSLSNSKSCLFSLDKSSQRRKPLKLNTTRHVVCKLLGSPLPNLSMSFLTCLTSSGRFGFFGLVPIILFEDYIICLMIGCSVGEAIDIFLVGPCYSVHSTVDCGHRFCSLYEKS